MVLVVSIETVVVALLALLVAGLLRSHGEILRRLHALDAGGAEPSLDLRPRGERSRGSVTSDLGPAHDVGGETLRDEAIHVPVVGVEYRTLVAFLSSGCLTCREFWDALRDRDAVAGVGAAVRVVIVTKDRREESIAALRELAPSDVPVIMSSSTWEAYDVPGSPYFVLADGPTGRVLGAGTGVTWEQVRTLMLQSLADLADGADSRERRIDRELLLHGIGPGDASLFRTAEEIAREA
jgi:hypothetical protein